MRLLNEFSSVQFSSIVYTSATPSYNDSCAVRCVTADATCPTKNVCTYIRIEQS